MGWSQRLRQFRSLRGDLFLDEELRRNALRKTGALLSKGAFRSLKQRINPEQFGGAPLLGLRKHVIKAHGSSNRNHVCGAIKIALDLVQCDMISQVLADINSANEILCPSFVESTGD